MLQQALEFLRDEFREAAEVQNLKSGRTFDTYVGRNGELIDVPRDVPARDHVACDLESLAKIVSDRENVTIYHDGNKVVAVMDDADSSMRDDVATWSLTTSGKYSALTEAARKPRSQADFVKFIVQNLRDEFEENSPGLLGVFRNLKFATSDEQKGDVQHGRESMGRAIANEVTGAGLIPETVTVRVRRWATLGIDLVVSLECLIVVDLDARTIKLEPLADQIEQAENFAHAWLGEKIAEEIPLACVVYGRP